MRFYIDVNVCVFLFVALVYRIYKTATPLGKAYNAILHISSQLYLCHDFCRLVFLMSFFYTVPSFQHLSRNVPSRSVFSFQISKSRHNWISCRLLNWGITLLPLSHSPACVFGRYVRVLNSSAVLYRNLCVSTTENYIRDISGSY